MPSSDAGWDVYAEQMARANHGIALWDPSPTDSYTVMKRGYVGYIVRGCFELLFDANSPIGDRVLGRDVPDDFEPLPPEANISRRRLRPPINLFLESKRAVSVTAEVSTSSVVPSTGGTFSYSSTSSRGALLITQDWLTAEDSVRERFYRLYIKKHHRSWLQFAESQGHEVSLKDLILVTGHDNTREFAMAAFADNNTRLHIAFRAGMQGVAGTSVSVWGSWETSPMVHRNCGPPGSYVRTLENRDQVSSSTEVAEGGLTTSIHSTDFNQCIFIRGYRMRERAGFFTTTMKAAAGPSNLPDEPSRGHGPWAPSSVTNSVYDDEECMRVDDQSQDGSSIKSATPYRDSSPFADPLEPIFDYIFEHTSAPLALVHDSDLAQIIRDTQEDSDLAVIISKGSPNIEVVDGVAQLSVTSGAKGVQHGRESFGQKEDMEDLIATVRAPSGRSRRGSTTSSVMRNSSDLSFAYPPSPYVEDFGNVLKDSRNRSTESLVSTVSEKTGQMKRRPRGSDLESDNFEDFVPGLGSVATSDARREEIRKRRIESEQRRRDEIRDAYHRLKETLPISNQKSSKVSLLDRATGHIKYLETKQEQSQARLEAIEADIARLRHLNEVLIVGNATQPHRDCDAVGSAITDAAAQAPSASFS